MTARIPLPTAEVPSNSPNGELTRFPCVLTTMMSPDCASEMPLCSMRLSPEWHHTVTAGPMTRGEFQMGRISPSIAPMRDMESATWALDAPSKVLRSAASGRVHDETTRKPGLLAIRFPFLYRRKCSGNSRTGLDLRPEVLKGFLDIREVNEH